MKVLLFHLRQGVNSLEKTLMLGKIEGRRRRQWQRMRWLDGITDSMTWVWANSGRWWKTGKPGVLQSMGMQRVRHDLVNGQQLLSHRTVYFTPAWALPYGTCLSIQFGSSIIFLQGPTLPPASLDGWPFPLPCLRIRRYCLFVWTFSWSITWHGFLRLSRGVNEPRLLIHPCILP